MALPETLGKCSFGTAGLGMETGLHGQVAIIYKVSYSGSLVLVLQASPETATLEA